MKPESSPPHTNDSPEKGNNIKKALYRALGGVALAAAVTASLKSGDARAASAQSPQATIEIANDNSIPKPTITFENTNNFPAGTIIYSENGDVISVPTTPTIIINDNENIEENSPAKDTPVVVTFPAPDAAPAPNINTTPVEINFPAETEEAQISTSPTPSVPEDTPVISNDALTIPSGNWDGLPLDSKTGRKEGPSGPETFYDLHMREVVDRMRAMGNTDEYWIREDGAKMLGPYIIVAADLNVHPRGSIVQTSLGPGIVCDTGDFAKTEHTLLDLATNWKHHETEPK